MRASTVAVFVAFCALTAADGDTAALSGGDSSSSDSSDSSDSVPFHRIKTCQECVESGFGWCPIRRACGGFQNRNCIGDNDERDFARARVEVVTDADMQFPPFTSTQLNRVFLVYDSSATEKALIDAFENAAIDSELAGRGGPVFISADMLRNKKLAAVLHADDAALPRLHVYRKAAPDADVDPATATADAMYTGPWTTADMLEFVRGVASARIPELDLKVKDFVESMLQSLAGGDAADVAVADMRLIIEDVQAVAESATAVQADAAKVYVSTMERIVENPMKAMGWLSTRVNHLNANAQVTDELEILQSFTMQLLG